MAYFFVDTSCLVKRYVQEAGREGVLAILEPGRHNAIYICDAAGPELVAAVVRRARGPVSPALELGPALAGFRRHWRLEYRRVGVSGSVIDRALGIAKTRALRGYDAIHLAAALQLADAIRAHRLPPLVFVSADKEQLAAAAAEGLATLNPEP